MANGQVHEAESFALSVGIGVGIISALWLDNPADGSFIALGTLSGIYLTPDLDIDGWIRSKRNVVNALGAIGYIWFGFWYPYARAIKHRHWLSHAPIVSTLIRVAYIGIIPFAVLYSTGTAVPDVVQTAVMLWIAGLMVSDAAHWARDGFPI